MLYDRVIKAAGFADTAIEGEVPSYERMKVNDPNLSSLATTGAGGLQQTDRTGQGSRTASADAGAPGSSDDVHLSELVQSLRSLAADSPERQARIEQIARSYANGTYQVDAEGTASKMIDDAFEP